MSSFFPKIFLGRQKSPLSTKDKNETGIFKFFALFSKNMKNRREIESR